MIWHKTHEKQLSQVTFGTLQHAFSHDSSKALLGSMRLRFAELKLLKLLKVERDSFLLLVVARPGAPSSVLAPSSDARSP